MSTPMQYIQSFFPMIYSFVKNVSICNYINLICISRGRIIHLNTQKQLCERFTGSYLLSMYWRRASKYTNNMHQILNRESLCCIVELRLAMYHTIYCLYVKWHWPIKHFLLDFWRLLAEFWNVFFFKFLRGG